MDRFETQDSFNGSPAIVAKVDAFTVIFNNMSFSDVIKTIGISEMLSPDYVELFNSRFFTTFGYGSDLKMSYNGIGFAAPVCDLLDAFKCNAIELLERQPDDIFEKRLPSIRVDMMGSALDYIRSVGVDIDNMVFNPLPVPAEASYHYTRLDFAYDLLNFMGEFVDLCISACNLYQNENHLIHTKGANRPLHWEAKTGYQKTLYLGKSSANRFLRIYDKKLQYENSNKFVTDCPYYGIDQTTGERILPSSWVRIEMQTRKECCQIVDDPNASMLTVFRFIYDTFAIKEGTGNNVPVCQFWLDIFDWSVITNIIQNAKYVKYKNQDVFSRSIKYFTNTALGTVVFLLASMGPEAFFNLVNQSISELQQKEKGILRWNRMRSNILQGFGGHYPAYLGKFRNGIFQITDYKFDKNASFRELQNFSIYDYS